jgi:predicted signal transduction protein with EAL and GGDEF domain
MRSGLQGFFVRQPLWVSIPLIVALSVASSVGTLFLLTELMGMPYGPSFRRSLAIAITAPVLVSAPIGGWIVHLLREVELARQQAQALAWNDERVRAAAQQMEATLASGRRLRCTVSIGLSDAGAADSFDTLIARADKAMYLAKAGGKNRVVVQAA